MKLSFSLLGLLPAAIYAQTNNTNGIGSTPSQRFAVSSTQAQSIIKAALANATAENIPQNIAVVDPSGILVAFRESET